MDKIIEKILISIGEKYNLCKDLTNIIYNYSRLEQLHKNYLCLENRTLTEKIIQNFKNKNTKIVLIKNLDNKERKLIHIISEKYGLTTKTVNRRANDIADLELSSIDLKNKKISKKNKYKNNWTGNCNICDELLLSDEALYNVFIGGPYCEDCVENDEELNCHKWENFY